VTAGAAARVAPGARRTPRLLAAAAASLVVLLTGLVIAESLLGDQGSEPSFAKGTGLLLTLWVIAAVGLVVAWHQPANPIGWLLLAAPVCLLLTFASDGYVEPAYHAGHHALPVVSPVALVFAQEFFASFIVIPLVIMLFPGGHLPPGRWRWAVWAYLALTVPAPLSALGVAVGALVGHHVHVLSDGQLAQVENTPASMAWFSVVGTVFFFGLLAGWVGALGRQVVSWRRSSGERRQQLKWLLSGAAVCGIFLVASFTSSNSLWEVLMLGVAALPVSIGIGILKYRLYEIDRIISRTLAYALVTGSLIGVYAGLVLLATRVLSFSSPVAVAASTLVAAALFNPLRRRVQRVVDRRFNRARYDADRMVAEFAARLNDAVDLDAVRADLASAVHQALEPTYVSVWVAGGSQ
jgi:hypothetical protein